MMFTFDAEAPHKDGKHGDEPSSFFQVVEDPFKECGDKIHVVHCKVILPARTDPADGSELLDELAFEGFHVHSRAGLDGNLGAFIAADVEDPWRKGRRHHHGFVQTT